MAHGSLVNLISSNTRSASPEVGMGATIILWSDRHAATVIGVSESGKVVHVQRDHAQRTDTNGMSDSQSYEYSPNPNARIDTFTLRKNGRWVRRGDALKNGTILLIGQRDEHYDYSF